MAGFFTFAALHAQAIGFREWSLVLLEFGLIVVAARVVFAKLPDRVAPFRLGSCSRSCRTGSRRSGSVLAPWP